MTKVKAILRIESFSVKDGTLLLSVSDYGVRSAIKSLEELSVQKYGGYIKCEITPPYKSRTTGNGSQNSKIWAMIQEIARATGNDIEDIEDYIKDKATARGYPYKVNKISGAMKPESMTKINTVDASLLIDELYKLAAELGITLEE
jgi:hypothetical protein